MKKQVIGTVLSATMVAALVAGCGSSYRFNGSSFIGSSNFRSCKLRSGNL